MKKKYIKPAYRVKDLKVRLLTEASKVGVDFNRTGKLDAKGCSFDFYEDEYYDDEQCFYLT